MNEQNQQVDPSAPETLTSILAKQETFGEKKFAFWQGTVVNFWLNLLVSGVFTYWFSHSKTEIKLPFLEKNSPSGFQKAIADKIHEMPFMSVFGEKAVGDVINNRRKFASNAANVFTLTTGGHFIVIPSVWLGAKIKAGLVRKWDREHYGDEAMSDPGIVARHEALDTEERPTLLGAVFGRLGAIVATQATAYVIGNPSNALHWLGERFGVAPLRRFRGMDEIAGVVGNKIGEATQEFMPEASRKFDQHAIDKGFDWSLQQLDKHPELAGTPYRDATLHMGKYLAQDVLYTAVTAVSINPAINALKHVLPGMTYRPTAKAKPEAPVIPLPRAQEAAARAANETPQTKIRHIHNEATIAPRTEKEILASA